jgi:nucleoside-diphosphate-sugar epimerase
VFTEAEFASVYLDIEIKKKIEGVKTAGNVLYVASKTAAERAVWKFRDEHKPAFAISTINPSVVVGPPIILP